MILLCAVVMLTSCSKDDQTPVPVPVSVSVAFNSLTADGSATETTMALTLTFDKAIEGLVAEDITLTAGETGATRGALTAKGNGVYELAVSAITKDGEVTVAVAKAGYTVTPASKTVTVSYVVPSIIGHYYYSDKTHSATYNNTKTCIGIVFWQDPTDATKGKIVSLDEGTDKAWSTENILAGATSHTDGAENTAKVLALGSYTADTYPAFGWCEARNSPAIEGIRWYIPAKEELKDGIYANVATLNTSLSNISGATQISINWYYSSTEDSFFEVWYVGFNDGLTMTFSKHAKIVVRAVSAF